MSDLPHLCSICINAQSEVVNNRTVTIGSIIAWCYDCNRCVKLSGERQSIRAAIDALDEHGAGDTHTPMHNYDHLDDYFPKGINDKSHVVVGRCNTSRPALQPVRCPRPSIARPGKLRRPRTLRNAHIKCI